MCIFTICFVARLTNVHLYMNVNAPYFLLSQAVLPQLASADDAVRFDDAASKTKLSLALNFSVTRPKP